MIPSPTDIAWAAGLFEGEGSIALNRRGDRPNSQPQACLNLRMTDEDVVRRFHAIVGVGSVRRYEPSKGGTKPFWQWGTSGYAAARHITILFWGYLGERRRSKAIEVLMNCSRPGSRQEKSDSLIRDREFFLQ